MNLIKDIRCIICLLKCSKYLYYAKKVICIITLIITTVTALNILRSGKLGLLKELM